MTSATHTMMFIAPVTAVFPAVLWMSGGNLPFALLCCVMTALLALTLFRPEWSFRVMIGSVLLFDQYRIPGFVPWTHQAGYLNNLKEIDYLPYVHLGMMTPLELHLAMLALAVGVRSLGASAVPHDAAASPRGDRSVVRSQGPSGDMLWLLPLAAWIAISVARGVASNGDVMVALWETRALGTFVLVFFITPLLVRSDREWRLVMWIAIGAITFKALQAIVRFVQLGFSTGGMHTLTSHEDAVFINTLLLFLAFLAFHRVRDVQSWVLSMLIPILAAGFLLSMRRAAYASLMVSALAFVLMQPWEVIRRLAVRSMPLALVFGAYAAIGWNIDHPLTLPVQMVKSGIAPEGADPSDSAGPAAADGGERSHDYYSNLYRSIENYNLGRTAIEHPVAGTGFGKAYRMEVALPRISFPLMEFIPHNQILWIFVKSGVIGFVLFWAFFLWMPMKGILALRSARDPWLRAFLSLAAVSVVNQMVTSYFDLQLTYTRNMVYLAVLMAGIASIQVRGATHRGEVPDGR